MLIKNKLRAVYSRTVYGNVIAIVDLNQGKSVTNDAENVIKDLDATFDLSNYRVIYKDSRNIWDELLVDSTRTFAGFRSLNETELSSALARLNPH